MNMEAYTYIILHYNVPTSPHGTHPHTRPRKFTFLAIPDLGHPA